MTAGSSLTQLIPTHNRSRYLRRSLLLLSQTQCPNEILVIDSSSGEEQKRTERVIDEFRHKLKLTHQHSDDDIIQKCSRALQQVGTQYAVFCADDDFQIPSTLTSAVQFLDTNPDYASCMGHTLFVSPSTPVTLTRQICSTLAFESPSQRVQAISLDGNYTIFYGVHRTDLLRERFDLTSQSCAYTRTRVLPEILLCQLCALQGKLKVLNEMITIRQSHSGNESSRTPCIQDISSFPQDYRSYQECLAKQLHEHSDLGDSEMESFVDQVFADYSPRLNLRSHLFSGIKRRISRVFRERRRQKMMLIPKRLRKQRVFAAAPELQVRTIQEAIRLILCHPDGIAGDLRQPNAA